MFRRYPRATAYFIIGFIISGIAASCNGLYQYFTGWDWVRKIFIVYNAHEIKYSVRITSFFNLPTTYAYALSMFCLFVLAFSLSCKRWYTALLGLAVFGFSLFNLAITYTRGAWIAFTVGALSIVFMRSRRLIIPWIVAIMLLGVVLVSVDDGFNERITSLFDLNYYSNLQRLELWRANFEIFKDHPIFGAGFGRTDQIVQLYHDRLGHKEAILSHAHNSYLQYLAGTGIVGLLFFLAVLLYHPARSLRDYTSVSSQRERSIILGFLAIQICFLTSCLFDCNFGDSEVRYSFLTLMALASNEMAIAKGVIWQDRASNDSNFIPA